MKKNIIVQYDPAGRMGNRMFQYAAGYVLSKQLDYNFFYDELPNFKIERKLPTHHLENIYRTRVDGNNSFNIDKIKNHNGDIIVDSYAQRSEYFIPYRDDLIKEFNLPAPLYNIPEDALLVHIRETDYKDINFFLGYDFYKKAIEDSNFNNVYIVTDNSYCETVQKLVAEGCKLVTEGYVDKFELSSNDRSMFDFMSLYSAKNIFLSQSSFSWWAAFLGDHNKIIFPYKEKNVQWPLNPGSDDIDLYFDLENISVKYFI